MGWLRRLSPRAEKTIRLVTTCVIAAPLGFIAVADDNETLGYIAVGIVVAGILAGPVMTRLLDPGETGGGR